MTWSTIALDVDARGVARLLLDRPEKHNVLCGEMCDELGEAAARIGADPRVRVVVLTGRVRASAPLAWMREQVAANREGRMAEARRLARMLDALNTLHFRTLHQYPRQLAHPGVLALLEEGGRNFQHCSSAS